MATEDLGTMAASGGDGPASTDGPPSTDGPASTAAPGAPTLTRRPERPCTLAIDIGGTGLKASVLDATGAMVADRVRVPTTYPMSPPQLVDRLVTMVAPLPEYDRISAGFPGMVRGGRILSAPQFGTEGGLGTRVVDELVHQWFGFDLAAALSEHLAKPARVANDADVQGAAVVQGKGLELVITLGTGVGTALFYEGRLLPHLEFAHHPFRKGETYNQQIGEGARKEVGSERWNRRVHKAVATFRALTFFDHCYLGGGNSRRVTGLHATDVTIVDNAAGILGGIKLWNDEHLAV
ncbi:MAG TPA: ROK family protein [Acidimicrobiales bacterium]|nr:ROK family protein [Acidimicrobiales bacterium]